jgi:ribonuclease HI
MYTDGACLGNPGPGGYGAVILTGNERVELSAGYRLTTNNRMELMGAIAGLRSLKVPSKVLLYTDSRYVVDAVNLGWAEGWRARGWRKANRDRALNSDLWKELLDLLKKHDVTLRWVEGHAGVRENERADRLSVQAAQKRSLLVDTGYEGEKPTQNNLF